MQPHAIAIAVAVAVVVAAIVALVVAYVRYRSVARRADAAERRNAVRRGRIDLEQRFVRPDGTLRTAAFDPSTPPRVVSPAPDDAAAAAGGGGAASGITNMVRNGTLVQMLNRLATYGQDMKSRIDHAMHAHETDEERLERAVAERCGDEATHPLFRKRWHDYQKQKQRAAAAAAATEQTANDDDDDALRSDRL